MLLQCAVTGGPPWHSGKGGMTRQRAPAERCWVSAVAGIWGQAPRALSTLACQAQHCCGRRTSMRMASI